MTLVDVKIGDSSGLGEVLAAYALQPDGLVFDTAITLTMTADVTADHFVAVVDQCPDTQIPESVPSLYLGKNRWALVNDDTVFDTDTAANEAPEFPHTVADTAGCSFKQIINAMGLGGGHTKFGGSSSAMDDWISSLTP